MDGEVGKIEMPRCDVALGVAELILATIHHGTVVAGASNEMVRQIELPVYASMLGRIVRLVWGLKSVRWRTTLWSFM